MSDVSDPPIHSDLPAPDALREGPKAPRGWVGVAWLVIVAAVAFTAWLQAFRFGDLAEGGGSRGGLPVMEFTARYLVGSRLLVQTLGQGTDTDAELATQAKVIGAGGTDRRLRSVIVVAEISGPTAALDDLKELDKKETLSQEEEKLRLTLRRLYNDLAQGKSDAPALDESDRALLRDRLGWFGRLALSQLSSEPEVRSEVEAQALQTTLVVVAGLAVAGVAAFAGFVGLCVLSTLLARGKLPVALNVPSGRGGVYAETFALWLVVFLAMSLGFSYVPMPRTRLLFSGLAMILSLVVALSWPVLRGIPWIQVRHDVGLTTRGALIREVFAGVATYAMALPLLLVGVGVMLILMRLRSGGGAGDGGGDGSGPVHPIVEALLGPNWAIRLQVLALGSLLAPLVEETMFRGVLYYHLRDAGARLPRATSMLIGGTIVSFLFAAIHPQGLIAVPALMGLAYGFTLGREWRGSLVSSMVAHGINNGAVLLMLIAAMGG